MVKNTAGVEAYPSVERGHSALAYPMNELRNDEYEDDWERYKDFKNSIKANDKVKKRKHEAHISLHERLDDRIDKGTQLVTTSITITMIMSWCFKLHRGLLRWKHIVEE
ncbi:11205_t:CDS:2, partial [Gigaspora margarita]